MGEPQDEKGEEQVLGVAADFALGIGWGKSSEPTRFGPRLKDERRELLKDIFHEFDTDGSGGLGLEEMTRMFRKLGMSASETEELLQEADKNKNGVLDLEEFIDWLYGKDSEANLVLEYGDALKPLFEVFDRDNSGTILFREFQECHGLLRTALEWNRDSQDSHAGLIDPMMLDKDAKEAFAQVDKNGDGSMSFIDFARYMQGTIKKSGIPSEDLAACTRNLSAALEDVFHGIRMAEMGEIAEDNPMALASRVTRLSVATQDLQKVVTERSKTTELEEAEEKTRQRWIDPPMNMQIGDLKMLHLKSCPMNMRLIASCYCNVLCFPSGLAGWVAEVSRTITYRSGKSEQETPSYYNFKTQENKWTPITKNSAASDFTGLLRGIGREMGTFCILKTHCNFASEIQWEDINQGLQQAVDIGWLTAEQRLDFVRYMEDKVRSEVPAAELEKDPQGSVHAQLLKLVLSPRLVMATLTKLSIMTLQPTWASHIQVA